MITLRNEFAIRALVVLIEGRAMTHSPELAAQMARTAFEIADAMLEAADARLAQSAPSAQGRQS